MLSAREIAKDLNTSHVTIYRWVEDGMPHTYEKKGNRMVIGFDLEKSKEWFEKNKHKYRVRSK